MHLYLYDAFLYTKNYSKVIDKIENRLTDLGIKGTSLIIDTQERMPFLIENEVKKGANTLVVVGNDSTLTNAIRIVSQINPNILSLHKTIFALIPIDKNKVKVGDSLGIEVGEKACETLVQRRVLNFDVCSINNKEDFLTKISFQVKNEIYLLLDNSIEINIKEGSNVSIVNLPTINELNITKNRGATPSPEDGRIEVIIECKKNNFGWFKEEKKPTIMRAKNIKINGEVDNFIKNEGFKITNPKVIKIKKRKLGFVVGKHRLF